MQWSVNIESIHKNAVRIFFTDLKYRGLAKADISTLYSLRVLKLFNDIVIRTSTMHPS